LALAVLERARGPCTTGLEKRRASGDFALHGRGTRDGVAVAPWFGRDSHQVPESYLNGASRAQKARPGVGTAHGTPFNDYQFEGYAGAISKVCYWPGKASWFSWRSIVGFRAYYAGQEATYHGGDRTDCEYCFELLENEVIYHIQGRWLDGASGLMSLQFCTRYADAPNWRRCSKPLGEDNRGGSDFLVGCTGRLAHHVVLGCGVREFAGVGRQRGEARGLLRTWRRVRWLDGGRCC